MTRSSSALIPAASDTLLDPGKLEAAKEPSVKINGGWPSGRIDLAASLGAQSADRYMRTRPGLSIGVPPSEKSHGMSPAHAALGTEGRPLPPVTPQTVGRYFKQQVGVWPSKRVALCAAVNENLGKLATLKEGPQQEQLHLEITLHWHCLCEVEKRAVLNALGTSPNNLLGDTSRPAADESARTPVRDWLEHTAVFETPERATRLLSACSSEARERLGKSLILPTSERDLVAMLKDRFVNLRNTMPVDHMYDYTGFLWDNHRVCGTLPEEAKKLKVCIAGGGPSGIIAGDLFNRLGVNVHIKEQHSQIGGRMRTERMTDSNGRESPTPIQPGAMRFHTTRGNAYWSIAKHYELPHRPFPNPSTVTTAYIIGNKVELAAPGVPAPNEVMQKVAADVNAALVETMLLPVTAARDAGNTAEFRELCDKYKEEFDGKTFAAGLESLLEKQGIKWSEEEWDVFRATGIGVGGYGGYMGTGFLEEFRFLVDERLEGHQQLLGGADAPLRKMIADEKGLPDGVESLEKQGAIQVNVEITGVKKIDGRYHVSSLNKETNESSTDIYDEFVFAGGPTEAKRLGLTGHQEGSESLMPVEFGSAMEKANVVGATKLAIKVPKKFLGEHGQLPGNLQTNAQFQQSYLTPPMEGSDNAVWYTSYTLGDNAPKMAAIPPEEQLTNFVKKLRDVASQSPADQSDQAAYEGLRGIAYAVEQNKDRFSYAHWGLEKHFGGAFKMDEPNQLNNTRELWSALLKPTDGAIFINEENTFEGGFASGAVAAAINGTQQFIVKHGGELPPNSPFDQERL